MSTDEARMSACYILELHYVQISKELKLLRDVTQKKLNQSTKGNKNESSKAQTRNQNLHWDQ